MELHQLGAELRARGRPERAAHEKAYLKSRLDHFGTSVPAIRSVARAFRRGHPGLDHDELVAVVEELWATPVHECRMAVVELLLLYADVLTAGDVPLLERFLREAQTWAVVDSLAASVVGPLVEREPGLGAALDRWAADDDVWLRRSALLAQRRERAAVLAARRAR